MRLRLADADVELLKVRDGRERKVMLSLHYSGQRKPPHILISREAALTLEAALGNIATSDPSTWPRKIKE